jgi:senataxin
LHIRQYNKYYDEVRRIAMKPTGSRGRALDVARRAKPRLLVCAPSNAAIDNIILKIMEDGFIDGKGQRYNPLMVRVGVHQSIAVRDVSLMSKVDALFAEQSDPQQIQAAIDGYKGEVSRITGEIARLRHRLTAIAEACPWPLSQDWEIRIDEEGFETHKKAYFVNHRTKQTTYEQPPPAAPNEKSFKSTSMPSYQDLIGRIVKLVDAYYSVKSHLERCIILKQFVEAGSNREMGTRLELEDHVLGAAHLVMTTLGSAGSTSLINSEKFEVVVVDEAAQSVELAALSALKLGSKHVVLVGDPQQVSGQQELRPYCLTDISFLH